MIRPPTRSTHFTYTTLLRSPGNLKKRECGGQLKVFEKREMTVNGEGNGWTKKVETIESVSEKYFFFEGQRQPGNKRKKRRKKEGSVLKGEFFFFLMAKAKPEKEKKRKDLGETKRRGEKKKFFLSP